MDKNLSRILAEKAYIDIYEEKSKPFLQCISALKAKEREEISKIEERFSASYDMLNREKEIICGPKPICNHDLLVIFHNVFCKNSKQYTTASHCLNCGVFIDLDCYMRLKTGEKDTIDVDITVDLVKVPVFLSRLRDKIPEIITAHPDITLEELKSELTQIANNSLNKQRSRKKKN